MYKNLRMKISARTFAEMLKISEGDLTRLHQTTNAINGVQLPRKDWQGYRMQDALEFVEKIGRLVA